MRPLLLLLLILVGCGSDARRQPGYCADKCQTLDPSSKEMDRCLMRCVGP